MKLLIVSDIHGSYYYASKIEDLDISFNYNNIIMCNVDKL